MSVLDLPEDHILRRAHAASIYHRAAIEASSVCGCFYCAAIFLPGDIADWTDRTETQDRQTALCPRCGIDSVIGDASPFPVTPEFLAEMKAAWFGDENN